MKTLQLLKDNVLVSIHEKMHTEGGIFLPEIARDRHDYRTGTVFAVGADVQDFEATDEVVLDFGGQWTRIDGVLYAVVKEKNVMAVITKEEM
jgi:co-chaperonin GroES (HSP10)